MWYSLEIVDDGLAGDRRPDRKARFSREAVLQIFLLQPTAAESATILSSCPQDKHEVGIDVVGCAGVGCGMKARS